jgi:hypothetical protein
LTLTRPLVRDSLGSFTVTNRQQVCPDIVTQGTGTVAALARELKWSGDLYCWWD